MKQLSKKRTFILITFIFFIYAGKEVAAAAPQTFADRMQQLEAARRREEEQQAQINAPAVRLQEESQRLKIVELPEEEISFYIREIIIETTNEQYKFNWLKKITKHYENKNIGIQGINIISELLSEEIIEKGYITTQVGVPEQDLTQGTLIFSVVPGTISDIYFAAPNTSGTWKNAFPTKNGKILNIRTLEQGLEQMKRVPNQDVKMDLRPGENLGESEVVISVERTKPWSLSFSLDDSNIKSTGRLQSSANLSLYNPTGLNDIFSFSYGTNAEGQNNKYGIRNHSLYYSLPLKNYTFSFANYKNRHHQVIQSYVPFKSSSESQTYEFTLQRLLYRDQKRKTQGQIKLSKRDRHNYIDDFEIEVQRQKTTSYQLALQDRYYAGRSVLDTMIYYQKGVPWFGAKPGYGDNDPTMGTSRYSLWGLNFYLYAPAKLGSIDARYSLTIRAQYTKNMLYSSDHFSIGGRYTVRGFSGENTLAAENGFIIRNEFSFPLQKLKNEIYLGLDAGHVWGPSDYYLVGKNLAGAALGLRGSLFSQLQYDVFISTPIYKPQGFSAGKTALGFQIYWQF